MTTCVLRGGARSPRARAPHLIQRRFTRAAVVGLAGHVFFELGSGVGMPLASLLGPRSAAGLWAGATIVAWHATSGDRESADKLAGLANGLGLAAVSAHYLGWPTRRTAVGLPWLTECEGLGTGHMRAYNLILYASSAAALTGLALESGRKWRLGLTFAGCAVPVLVVGQRWEFRRLQKQARTRPGWWNRRLN